MPPHTERKHIEIKADNVELAGAGRLEFTADAALVIAAMAGAPFTRGQASWGEGEIVFDRAGRTVSCIPGSSGIEARAEEALCSQIKAQARFHNDFGFGLPYDVGRPSFSMRLKPAIAPNKPIAFSPAGKGEAFTLVMTGKVGAAGCSILYNPFGVADSEAVCKAWIAAGRPGLSTRPSSQRATGKPKRARIAARTPSRSDLVEVFIKVDLNAREVLLDERLLLKNLDIVYPAVPLDQSTPKVGNGTLQNSISSTGYPRQALIEEIGGRVKVIVGFEREGSPLSCRPVQSSGTAYLDNATCEIAMRRLRYEFSPEAPAFRGMRYTVADVRWVIPTDTDH